MPGTTRDSGSPDRSESGGGMSQPLLAELTAMVSSGAKIDAIKRYRFATGASLVEAKQVVDALAAGRAPGPMSPPIVGRPWQVHSSVPFTLAKAVGLMRLLAAFMWLCGLIAAGAAAWAAWERHVVSTAWPEVEAQTVKCKAVEHYRSRRTI